MGPETAYIALGANLGNARATLEEAVCRIGQFDGVTVTKCSSFYKTAPIDSSGPDYINAVIEVKTVIDERELLRWLLELEKEFGRVRPVGVVNAPRTMDLDLLLYGQKVSSDSFLELPHPRMHQRAFVLVPLLEIAPDVQIVGKGPAKNFLAEVADQGIAKLV